MNILYVIIPLLMVFLSLIGYAVWWSSRKGLFNGLQGPRHWCTQQREDGMPDVSRYPQRSRKR